MNPLMILKGMKVFVIAGVLLYGLTMVNDYRKDQQAKTDALITANAKAVSAEARAQTIAIANAQLEAITEAQSQALIAASEARSQIDEQFKQIQKTQNEQKSLLESNRLNEAVKGKRTLIVLRANRATKERFDEVESIFDGN
jgi:hypothetical protein